MTDKFFGLLMVAAFTASPVLAGYTPLLDKLYESGASPIESIYSVSPGNESDYNFVVTDGYTSEYYKISVKLDDLLSVADGSHAPGLENHKYYGSFDLKLPNGVTQTISYVYGKDNYDPAETTSGKTFYSGSSSSGQTILNKNIGYVASGSTLDTLDKKLYENNKFLVSIYQNNVIVGGGVISNEGTINTVNADFINNEVKINKISNPSPTGFQFRGGAIYNKGLIKEINGDFIMNRATHRGGAIYNAGGSTIEEIKGNFVANKAYQGGAIYNEANATINSINADFIANVSNNPKSGDTAAGIYNSGKIGSIVGNFVAHNISTNGGGIGNYGGTIDSIVGYFVGNITYIGSGIDNKGTIGDIYADFIGNGCKEKGCAIRNLKQIDSITGDFIGNYGIKKDDGSFRTDIAVIFNGSNGNIGSINGNFVGNKIVSIRTVTGTIGNIEGSFIENTNETDSSDDYVISISGSSTIIEKIKADFINNKNVIKHLGGSINTLSGKFINNEIAIYSDVASGKIEEIIDAEFIGNSHAIHSVKGGSDNNIGNVKGKFTKNIASSSGGAIAMEKGKIGNIDGVFSYNGVECDALSTNATSRGGAIHISASSSSGNISGSFIGNYVASHLAEKPRAFGGAIYNANIIQDINASFTGNYLDASLSAGKTEGILAQGGAIFNSGTINSISGGNFENNKITSTADVGALSYGGAILNYGGTIKNIISNFENNGVAADSADGIAHGGAISNANGGSITVSGNFINNFAKSDRGTDVAGGAIFNSGSSNITLLADGNDYKISGNYIEKGGAKTYEGIYLDRGKMIIKVANNGTWLIEDIINSGNPDGYTDIYLEIVGDNTGTVKLHNDVMGIAQGTISNTIIDLVNDKINTYTFSKLNSSDSDYAIDINFGESKADTFILTTPDSTGTINISQLNFADGNISDYIGQTKTVKVISDTGTGLVLSHDITGDVLSDKTEIIAENIKAVTKWSELISAHKINTVVSGGLNLDSQRGGNLYDGLQIRIDDVKVTAMDVEGDALNLMNTYNTQENRQFIASSINEIYTAGIDVGTTTSGSFEIKGLINKNARSTLDMNGYNGFNVSNATKLSFTDMAISNAAGSLVNISNADAVVNLINVNATNNSPQNSVISATEGKVNIVANKYDSIFDNQDAQYGILMSGGELNLQHLKGGHLIINDAINLIDADINIFGDKSGEVMFNNDVITNGNLALGDGAVVHLGLSTNLYVENMKASSSGSITTHASGSRILKLDVEVDRANNTIKLATITVANQLSGVYTVLVNALNQDKLDLDEDATVPFLYALNDTNPNDESFTVVAEGSPYEWVSGLNVKGETVGSIWYLDIVPDNDDNKHLAVRPEIMAAIGLHEAAIEQTRSVVRNVRNKVASGREYCPNCGLYDYAWNGSNLRNAWVLTQAERANIDKVADIDAKIWGVEAGFDFQNNANNTLGVFASYRNGDYDLNGKGNKYHSTMGSDIDIDSWLAGLYYRYDKNMNWLFATIYGGIQKAEVKTDDGYGKFDTDGVEFGASVEAGHTFALTRNITLDPSLGVYYTQVNFDDASDEIGKKYQWSNIKHLEAELGAKLTKQFSDSNVYVKPSVVQTLTRSDRVKITGLNKTDTYHDQTLGRIELGGRYGFTDALSGYAWANYTFGSSYEAYAGGLGLNYAW